MHGCHPQFGVGLDYLWRSIRVSMYFFTDVVANYHGTQCMCVCVCVRVCGVCCVCECMCVCESKLGVVWQHAM